MTHKALVRILTLLALVFAGQMVVPAKVRAQSECVTCNGNGDAGCSDLGPWDREFYGCCRPSLSDNRVCDPCCGGMSYFSVYGGGVALDPLQRETQTFIPLPLPGITIAQQTGTTVLDGYGVGSAVGFRVHPQLRLEADYTYRHNEAGDWFNRVTTNNVLTLSTVEPAAGSIDTHSFMFNTIYDITRPRVGCPHLYAGGGIGLLYVDGSVTNTTTTYTSSDSAFAWQAIVGAALPLSGHLDLFTEYRYLGANNLSVTDVTNSVPFGDFDFDSHSLFFGFRVYR